MSVVTQGFLLVKHLNMDSRGRRLSNTTPATKKPRCESTGVFTNGSQTKQVILLEGFSVDEYRKKQQDYSLINLFKITLLNGIPYLNQNNDDKLNISCKLLFIKQVRLNAILNQIVNPKSGFIIPYLLLLIQNGHTVTMHHLNIKFKHT